ncbi:MAG TPA: EAL domain-containing protein [Steroidobacteraceae bacterium]|jgi:EAL domain-containing protein (putative c-di-GMP-specific phosphodiesterase class I)|nr:EAL domain-containing protein [Steroidobacteraceae bacterium]
MSSLPAVLSGTASLDGLAGVYAHRITAALPLNWAQRISMHDSRGHLCWQSTADAWGPADLDAVRLALERFVGNSAPARADHELPGQRTAVLLRAADTANVFRGFVMLVMDNRRLRGKGKSINDLPLPVQRAAHDWAERLAAAPTVYPEGTELSAAQTERLIAFGPGVDEPEVEQFFARLRAFPVALAAQPLTSLQRGMRIRRYEVFLREAAAVPTDAAPVTLLREADDRRLGTVLDRRVTGALIVWLAGRSEVYADQPAQFSVNLSASSLADPNFLRFVELCLAKAGIAPALLAFEVDQCFWRKERGCLQRLSQGIEALGAGLVIDNATLHEQAAELLSLPGVRLAKIDRTLTRDLAASRAAQMRVAGLAQLARIGGVLTVAKQVERPEEQELLRALGVDFIQGHATAVPAPLAELDRQREQLLVIDPGVHEG